MNPDATFSTKNHSAKWILICLLSIVVFARSTAFSQENKPVPFTAMTQFSSPPIIMFDGEVFLEDVQAVVRGGVLFIPLDQALADMLDAQLITSAGTPMVVTFKTGSNVFKFTENSGAFTSAGSINSISDPPFSSNGVLYVPLYDLFKSLGMSVSYSGNILNITTGTIIPEIISDIPEFAYDPSTFFEKTEKSQADQNIATATDTAPEPTGVDIQYTYENILEFENIAVSGNQSQSNQDPKTDFYETLNLRFAGTAPLGYSLNSTLKINGTTDRTLNQGDVSRFSTILKNDSTSITLYDLSPKVSRFVLKSYQAQGVEYSKRLGDTNTTLLWGKSPKQIRESIYNRYVTAVVHEATLKDAKIGASLVHVKDTGASQPAGRLDNNVINVFADFKLKAFDMNVEVARSGSKVFYGKRAASTAKWIEAKYRDRETTFTTSYERVGSGFVSETSFFTPGRSEFTTLFNRKMNKNFTLGSGYKVTTILGETTTFFPIQINTTPFSFREKMRIKIQDNYEESRSRYGPRMTDKQKLDISDRVGKAKVDMSLERRRQRDSYNVWKFRNTQRYRYTTPMTKKTMLFLQYKHERKTATTNHKKRYYQTKFVVEPAEWSELSLNIERYYNGTSNDRWNSSISYKKLDIMNDREYGIEYGFQNYRQHNDNTFKVTYSFIR